MKWSDLKLIEDNYEKLNSKFYEKTGIDIQKGTVIDSFMLSIADMIQEAYDEIENKYLLEDIKKYGKQIY